MADDKTDPKSDSKGQDEKKTDTDESKVTGNETSPDDDKGTDEKALHIKKLNEENKKHRLEAKRLKEELDKYERALGALQGKDKPNLDPIEQERKAGEARLRRAILKAEVSAAARDAHDANALFRIIGDDLSDVEVDLENEKVDTEALTGKITNLRKSSPWLFAQKEETKKEEKKGKPSPDKGSGTTNENPYATYRNLLSSGRKREAQEFYEKNRSQVLAHME